MAATEAVAPAPIAIDHIHQRPYHGIATGTPPLEQGLEDAAADAVAQEYTQGNGQHHRQSRLPPATAAEDNKQEDSIEHQPRPRLADRPPHIVQYQGITAIEQEKQFTIKI